MDEIGVCDDRIQPSFVSKLIHTLDPNEPIYDGRVRMFLKTGDVDGNCREEREESAIRIYKEKIKSFYESDSYSDFRGLILQAFNEKYALVDSTSILTNTKKIDFILWALGKKGHKITEFEGM